jgi:hypothetical protein
VGRRDRERARRRHAIEKARRETGVEAEAKPERTTTRRASSSRPGGSRRPGGASPKSREELRSAYRSQFEHKGKVGDKDARGRVRQRDMIVHPKITRRVLFICLPLAVLGLFYPRLQIVTWFAYAIAFVGLADLARTKIQAMLMLALSVVALAFAVATVVGQTAA